MWNFLAGANLTMWTDDVYDPPKNVFPDRPAFNALMAVHDALKPTPLFRAGTWLLLCAASAALPGGGATRRQAPLPSAFAGRPRFM